MYTDFNNFFTLADINSRCIYAKVRLPPHLHFVPTLPSKTKTTGTISAIRIHIDGITFSTPIVMNSGITIIAMKIANLSLSKVHNKYCNH